MAYIHLNTKNYLTFLYHISDELLSRSECEFLLRKTIGKLRNKYSRLMLMFLSE